MRVNFVTDIPIEKSSGGQTASNKEVWNIISRISAANYLGPINPPPFFHQHIESKIQSILGFPRSFFAYSEKRLDSYAQKVHMSLKQFPCDLVFFFKFTPWVHVIPEVPYIASNDCTFLQYFPIYHDLKLFCPKGIKRIVDSEQRWLSSAKAVFFQSQWGADRAIKEYSLNKDRVHVTGLYGMMPLPGKDVYKANRDFLFISTNFEKKGGVYVVAAMENVIKDFPDSRLIVIGDSPPVHLLSRKFVKYVGFLDKNIPADHAELTRWFSTARGIIHPTTADINPLVLIEAGYHGCPAISTRLCAIPFIIQDGYSGLLIDNPRSVQEITSAIRRFLVDEIFYNSLRSGAWQFVRSYFTKDIYENKFAQLFLEASR